MPNLEGFELGPLMQVQNGTENQLSKQNFEEDSFSILVMGVLKRMRFLFKCYENIKCNFPWPWKAMVFDYVDFQYRNSL